MSVGGSLINPGDVQAGFLKKLKAFVEKSDKRFILIAGGGFPARQYIKAGKKFNLTNEQCDWVGIAATLLNAELLRHVFAAPPVQRKPKKMRFSKVLVAGGWLPGCSTDYDAVLWAKKYKAKTVVNLSNTDYVFTKDPRKFKNVKPIKRLSWAEFKRMFPSDWNAGTHSPFDPVASKEASRFGMRVGIINGARLGDVGKFLGNRPFVGSVIE